MDGTIVNQQADYNYDENPLAPTAVLAQSLLQLRHHQRDRLRPSPTPTGRATVSCSRWTPDSRRRGWAAGRTSSRSAAGAPPPRSAGWSWSRGAPRPSRTRPTSTERRAVWSPRRSPPRPGPTGSPSRCSSTRWGPAAPINAESQGIVGGEMAAPAVASLAAGPVRPARKDIVQLHPGQRRPGPSEPDRPDLRLGGNVGVLRSDRPGRDHIHRTRWSTRRSPCRGWWWRSTSTGSRRGAGRRTCNPTSSPSAATGWPNIYLTPLLVARLLTESYQRPVPGHHRTTPRRSTRGSRTIRSACSPIRISSSTTRSSPSSARSYLNDAGTLLVEEGNSDATSALWKWVLSDPEAVAWLDGSPARGPTRA